MSPLSILQQMPAHTAVAVVAITLSVAVWHQDRDQTEVKVVLKENTRTIQAIQRDYVTRNEMTSAIRDVQLSVREMFAQAEKVNGDKFRRLEQGQAELRNDIKKLLEKENE